MDGYRTVYSPTSPRLSLIESVGVPSPNGRKADFVRCSPPLPQDANARPAGSPQLLWFGRSSWHLARDQRWSTPPYLVRLCLRLLAHSALVWLFRYMTCLVILPTGQRVYCIELDTSAGAWSGCFWLLAHAALVSHRALHILRYAVRLANLRLSL